ncbi:MAG: hypothetical protein AAF715_29145 [Myxococcota bacterium]
MPRETLLVATGFVLGVAGCGADPKPATAEAVSPPVVTIASTAATAGTGAPPPRTPATCRVETRDFAATGQQWELLSEADGEAWASLTPTAPGKARIEVEGREVTFAFNGSGIELEGVVDRRSVAVYPSAPVVVSPVVTLPPSAPLPWSDAGDGAFQLEVPLGDDFDPPHLEGRIACDEASLSPRRKAAQNEREGEVVRVAGRAALEIHPGPAADEIALTRTSPQGIHVRTVGEAEGRIQVEMDVGDALVRGWVARARLEKLEPEASLRLSGFGQGGGGRGEGIGDRRETTEVACSDPLRLFAERDGAQRIEVGTIRPGRSLVIYTDEADGVRWREIRLEKPTPLAPAFKWKLTVQAEDLATCQPTADVPRAER